MTSPLSGWARLPVHYPHRDRFPTLSSRDAPSDGRNKNSSYAPPARGLRLAACEMPKSTMGRLFAPPLYYINIHYTPQISKHFPGRRAKADSVNIYPIRLCAPQNIFSRREKTLRAGGLKNGFFARAQKLPLTNRGAPVGLTQRPIEAASPPGPRLRRFTSLQLFQDRQPVPLANGVTGLTQRSHIRRSAVNGEGP